MENILKTYKFGKYSRIECLSWLDTFAQATKKKKYQRIKYDTWRSIKKLFSDSDDWNNTYIEVYGENVNFLDKTCDAIIFVPVDKEPLSPTLLKTDAHTYKLKKSNEFIRYLVKEILNFPDTISYSVGELPSFTMTFSKEDEDEVAKKLIEQLRKKPAECINAQGTSSLEYNAYDSYLAVNNGSWVNANTAMATTSVSTEYMENLSTALGGVNCTLDDFAERIKNIEFKINDKEKIMAIPNFTDNTVFNFDFGPVTSSRIRMSMYGYAIPNEMGKYVSYDVKNDCMMDVQILNFNCDNLFYRVPKALSKIDEGDVVFHNGVPVFVEDVNDNRLKVIDPKDGTEKIIMPARSPFGFDYVTTLVSLVDGFCDDCDPDEDNPFGNMLPFLLMGNGDMKNTFLSLMLMGDGKMDFNNPLMLLALSGDGKMDMSNPLMIMAMMKGFNK